MKGVTRARVTLRPPEATVDYDAAQAAVKDLIDAVARAEHPDGETKYKAKVKTPNGN